MKPSGAKTFRTLTRIVALFALSSAPVAAERGEDMRGVAAPEPPLRIVVRLKTNFARQINSSFDIDASRSIDSPPPLTNWLARHNLRRLQPAFPEQLRVQKRNGLSHTQMWDAIKKKFPKRASRAHSPVAPPDVAATYLLEPNTDSVTEAQRIVTQLVADADVEYARLDQVVRAHFLPNDPFFSSVNSWGQGYEDLYGVRNVRCPGAWDFVRRGEGIVIAVIDSGIDYTHPDLTNNIWSNSAEIPGNHTDDDGNGFIDDFRGWDFIGASKASPAPDNDPIDRFGHGTHVAGIVAAEGNNARGVVGVAWRSKIMAVKSLDDAGYSLDSLQAAAILYAANNGADVINASWGAKGSSPVIQDAVTYAHSLGVIFVAAIGNDSTDFKDIYPANFPETLSVSAVDYNDVKASFSNFGERLDVAAPGVDILSLQAGGTTHGLFVAPGYARGSGTSQAAPHVAGVIALVLAEHPDYSVEAVRQLLRVTADDVGSVGIDVETGYGRVHAFRALATVQSLLACRILRPPFGTPIFSSTPISGIAAGATFSQYILDYAAASNPNSWTVISQSTTPVDGGQFASFDPANLPDDTFTLRLRAINSSGQTFEDRIQLLVDNAAITSPQAPRYTSMTKVFKPGRIIPIDGRALGANFRRFRLDWAKGMNPSAGWSTAGVTLANSGSVTVSNSFLGTWNSSSVTQADFYTIRLQVETTRSTNAAQTSVYLEPDLLSTNWPRWLDRGPNFDVNVLPARDSNNNIRLVLGGNSGKLWSFTPDGSTFTNIQLSGTSTKQLAVAELGGAAGEEIVMVEGSRLNVFNADYSRTSLGYRFNENFTYAPVVLADMDGDGHLEILSHAYSGLTANIFVWGRNGSQLTANFPIRYPDSNFDANQWGLNKLTVVDLDRDGRPEIIVEYGGSNNEFSLRAFNWNGTSRPWPATVYSGRFNQICAGDLDRDGVPEVILSWFDWDTGGNHLMVFDPAGALKPGWPVTLPSLADNRLAHVGIADMDRDGKDEIIISAGRVIHVLKRDGTPLNAAWPRTDPYRRYSSIAVGDLDGDTFPEILTTQVQFGPSPEYDDIELLALRRDGTVMKTWRLFGIEDKAVDNDFTFLIDDLDRNGKVDIALCSRLLSGIQVLSEGLLSVLTLNAPFNATNNHWPVNLHDPRNTAARLFAPPRLNIQKSGTNVLLSWSALDGPRQLLAADTVSASTWTTPPITVVASNDLNTATFNSTNRSRFYRLR